MKSHYNKDINGWIILDKPQGISSNQALRKIQYLLHAKKAGHIGTLDPFATGVLPLAFGEATKLIPYLEKDTKTYEFTLKFGQATTTDDIEGEICQTSSYLPSEAEITAIIPQFMGEIFQTPPKYSAIHIDGERAYQLARQGTEFSIPPRQVVISKLELLQYQSSEACADFRVTCSKGTYVRTLGHDIAQKLNSCGHLTALRRTQNGFFKLSDTILLDNLKNMIYKTDGEFPILPVETFLCDITVIALTAEDSSKLKKGQAIDSNQYYNFKGIAAACYRNKLIALIAHQENRLVPIRVFNL
ncbi:tRNA pseudouridine(55) synthase TruB [bacterium]|nr:tRNA pseudouridine(55) synthase TruB [bacterium]MBR2274341.1 tRNA pseudouridine(55) synthase TruB [Alphaproteobacteria bacterium]